MDALAIGSEAVGILVFPMLSPDSWFTPMITAATTVAGHSIKM